MVTTSKLPKTVPIQVWRPPDAGIPSTAEKRNILKQAASAFVAEKKLQPPLAFKELRRQAQVLMDEHGIETNYQDFLAVLINNACWQETLATIPYERRLLMMPKCLRKEAVCPAPFDEFGLLCKQCGQCSLQDLQEEAERLGYAVLIAEGSALVTAIIETGKVDAIVGVSCLSVLEKAFPFMEAAAIPGVAIPLLQGDCIDTNVDLDWIWEIIHLHSDDQSRSMNLDAMRNEVTQWFEPQSMAKIMGPSDDQTEVLARSWLAKTGKRWRPFLVACAWRALQPEMDTPFPEDLKKLALAVECFHKASLIHDDIEDEDDTRYGEQTLHITHGVAVALNLGDLLIGEGYRLIATVKSTDPVALTEMMKVAAQGQRSLCLGQGAELAWCNQPEPLTTSEVVDIFTKKTAPAFEVALRLGAALAGANETVHQVLCAYSEAMGIAYQIRDDLDDVANQEDPNDVDAMRPSILMALAHQRATGTNKKVLTQLWHRQRPAADLRQLVTGLYTEYQVVERAENMLESYKDQAVHSLKKLENASLKGLLRRVIGRIFKKTEIKDWCREYETRNATDSEASPAYIV